MSPTQEFLGKEFVALRSEIDNGIKELRDLERYAIIATAGAWIWLITQEVWGFLPWAIPVIVVCIGAVRATAIFRHFGVLSRYIREELELSFGVDGWEKFLEDHHASGRKTLRVLRWLHDRGPWLLLVMPTVAALFSCLLNEPGTDLLDKDPAKLTPEILDALIDHVLKKVGVGGPNVSPATLAEMRKQLQALVPVDAAYQVQGDVPESLGE